MIWHDDARVTAENVRRFASKQAFLEETVLCQPAKKTPVAAGTRFLVCRVKVGRAGGIRADLPSIALTD